MANEKISLGKMHGEKGPNASCSVCKKNISTTYRAEPGGLMLEVDMHSVGGVLCAGSLTYV